MKAAESWGPRGILPAGALTPVEGPTEAAAESFLEELQRIDEHGTLQQKIDLGRFPSSLGGSTAQAGDYGELARRFIRGQYPDSAYWFARWAVREALSFLWRMDAKLGATDKADARYEMR